MVVLLVHRANHHHQFHDAPAALMMIFLVIIWDACRRRAHSFLFMEAASTSQGNWWLKTHSAYHGGLLHLLLEDAVSESQGRSGGDLDWEFLCTFVPHSEQLYVSSQATNAVLYAFSSILSDTQSSNFKIDNVRYAALIYKKINQSHLCTKWCYITDKISFRPWVVV